MKRVIQMFAFAAHVVLVVVAGNSIGLAQDGKLIVHVKPEHAYIFVDGRAIGEANKRHSLRLSPGDHTLELANYGFEPVTQTVNIKAGVADDVQVTLVPIPGTVSGPFGAMTIESASHDAVLLNGKTPKFFVGHGDEFNHEWGPKQELIVPPGNYQVTVLEADKELWSGPVDVPANQRVVVDIPKGVRKTVAWPRGEHLTSIPRFTVGTASATVAVAKPTSDLSVATAQINCGDSSQLKWNSSDAPQVEIAPVGQVTASGEQAIAPKQTTTYQLTALGPGGTATSSATVNVNTEIHANLVVSPGELRYKRVGDKVIEEPSAALTWTAANASGVSIDPLGTVDSNGNRTVHIVPSKTDAGAVDETVTYTLNAKNECGGTATQAASVHLVGSIEPPIELVLRSVYFPTDLPTAEDAQAGLLPGEQETLRSIADVFKRYLALTPGAHLILSGHADQRGPDQYNKDLSERRAQLAKSFLVEQGVPEDALEIQAYGDEQNLSADEVKQLLEQNSSLSEEDRQGLAAKLQNVILANNRRVDLTASTTGQQSLRQYPYKSKDFARLIDRNGPTKPTGVELASQKEDVAK